jgi:hypothetical protein
VINNSYVLGLYDPSLASAYSSANATVVRKKQPTAPWEATAAKQSASELLRTALSGRRFINESNAVLDVKGKDSADYRKIFAMYQGVNLLDSLVGYGAKTTLTNAERTVANRRFEAGVAELRTYLSTLELDGVRMVAGKSETKAQTTAAVARNSSNYVTGVIHKGGTTDAVEAFAGDVRFGIKVTTGAGPRVIDIDLSEMGAETRSLSNVTAHINAKLEAEGLQTRIVREQVAAEPRTLKVGDKTITLPDGPDQWALSVRGDGAETIEFVPTATETAVYVAQSDKAGNQELLKFQEGSTFNPAAQPFWVEGQVDKTALPEGIEAVRASAVGPDGSVWMVADVKGGLTNQPIKGVSDVVLMKLDSTGKVLTTRALGAADAANCYAIAIDDDGRVAVAGSVVGALVPGGSVTDKAVADSFVTVFDADGKEQWTHRRGARAADEATSVTFGDNGQVYVAGRAQSAMSGTIAVGGWDGYLQTFSESQVHSLAPVTAMATGAAQFGTSGDDTVEAMVREGNTIYTAGQENGRMVVRSFDVGQGGAPVLTATRDLGAASGGEIAGLSVVNGQVVVTGQTRNAALNVGQINAAHNGGIDVFVAVLNGDLNASGTESLTYFGGEGDDTAADVKVLDGKVWMTGVSNRPLSAKEDEPTRAYLSRIDVATGQVEWNQTWSATGEQAKTSTIAVASNGASVLDRLGLPQGEIGQKNSQQLVEATALRVGDRFYVTSVSTGREVAVSITANDTLQTLATKIERASSGALKVTVKTERDYLTDVVGEQRVTSGGVQRLEITFTDGRGGALLRAGESGRDALSGLGLTGGFIGPSKSDTKTIGIDLPSTLSIKDPASAKAASEVLSKVISSLREAYRAMNPTTAAAAKPKGEVPAYLQAQIANYQAALDRLMG